MTARAKPRRVSVSLRGHRLLANPMLNRGTAFTLEQRAELGLHGLLPASVSTLGQQVKRAYGYITRKSEPLERFVGLQAMQSRNAILYYRLLFDHLEEFLPIVYTPTVGQAVESFSHQFRRGQGLWVTPRDRGHIDDVLANAPNDDVRLIVVTDNERILGLGDQGAGGIGICIGKLALYTVAAGIHPSQCLPISLDVGTDNEALLADDLYLGWRERRLRGEPYDTLVEEFVEAVHKRWPKALLQWEDFKKANAFRLLDRYRDRLCSFNDDIQGTAAVALAGILSARRISEVPLTEHRILIVGGGAAGVGIGRLVRDALSREGLTGHALTRAIAVVDSRGLLHQGRELGEPHKEEFAWPAELVSEAGLDPAGIPSLMECVRGIRPHVLIGTTGQPGMFDEPLVRAMAEHVDRPAIFPFSNPTSKSEAVPADLIRWTDGRALIATGSPFDPVEHGGRTIRIGQGNNVYIFPGVGLGALAVSASRVTEPMFAAAARAVAEMVSAEDLQAGSLYPPVRQLRNVSAEVARAVGRAAIESGVAPSMADGEIAERVAELMWEPGYPELEVVSG